jgi:hypothetical protein
VLADGGTAHLRPVRPDDAELLRAFYARLSAESIYCGSSGARAVVAHAAGAVVLHAELRLAHPLGRRPALEPRRLPNLRVPGDDD